MIESRVEPQYRIVGTISQEADPRCQITDAIKEITVRDQIPHPVRTAMLGLVADLYTPECDAHGYHGSQELVVIAGHIHHPGATLGMSQYTAHHIAVALAPAETILLHPPTVDDVTHEIQGVAGMMFEEIVEQIGLAIARAKMYITDKDATVGALHLDIYSMPGCCLLHQ